MAKGKTKGAGTLRDRLNTYAENVCSVPIDGIDVHFSFPERDALKTLVAANKDLSDSNDPDWLRKLTIECLIASVQYEPGEPQLSRDEWGRILTAISIESQLKGEKLTAAGLFGELGLTALTVCGFRKVADALEGKDKEIADEVARVLEKQTADAEGEIGSTPS